MFPSSIGLEQLPYPVQADIIHTRSGSTEPEHLSHQGFLNKNSTSYPCGTPRLGSNPPLLTWNTISPRNRPMIPDNRRNLYVLGLPFSLTKQELDGQFSRFGTVSHSVILATVDSNSRRRGFVVMSRHEEALLAMKALSGSKLNGHTLDVSWAVVQRSKGFLDGGDRTTMVDSWSNEGPPSQDRVLLPTPASIYSRSAHAPSHSLSRSTLVVANLPTLLFSHPSDLDPLFRPYGNIRSTVVTASNENVMTVAVEYDTVANATEAAKSLQGQVYAGKALVIQFATPPDPMSHTSSYHPPTLHPPELSFTATHPNMTNNSQPLPYRLASPCDPSQNCSKPLAPLCKSQMYTTFPYYPHYSFNAPF